MCNQAGYRVNILGSLPQVQVLDNISRDGQRATGLDVLADIPGLEDYMDYLLSNTESSSNSMVEGKALDLATPKIDKALELFKRKAIQSSSDTSNALVSESELDKSTDKQNTSVMSEQNRRLMILEQQIANLLQPSRSKTVSDGQTSSSDAITRLVAERDIVQTDESDDAGSGNSQQDQTSRGRKGKRSRRSRIPGYRKPTASSRAKLESPETHSVTRQDELPNTPQTVLKQPSAYCITEDQRRDDAQSTYLQLMKELEKERERRWKAEQASKKLVDHIKSLQTKAKDGDQLKDTAIEATTRLKQALTNEREAKLRLQDDLDRTKIHLQEESRQLSVAKETEESLKKSLRNLEEVTAKMEREKLHQQTHEQKKAHDAQMRASALNRELEMLKITSEKQKGQIHQLQELLASREQQHRDEMKLCVRPNSQEMDNLIQQEKRRAEKQYEGEIRAQQDKVDQLTKQYSELEDEFRIALQIEANRFKEVQDVFQRVSDENAENKQALIVAQRKDEKMSEMFTELTALVKEQKGRITELSESKNELTAEYKDRIITLESHVEEARKRMLQMELLKQDKTKLLAQVEAQESVINGLKAERKLWGQELAQQGSSLAQDRGRLESKIETLKSELSTMKKQLDREVDALKIKTKMLEDQTETIRKLKEGLLERDEEVKRARNEALKIQHNLEEQLTEERAVTQDNQDTLERLRDRKQELKQQLSELQGELDESKKAHSILNNKWKEKSQLIGGLEKQVQEMRDTWEGKEHKLQDERDKAVHAASVAIEKLRRVDDTFRDQLEAKEQKHQEEILLLEQGKQQEVDQAYQRVYAVEEEMRELLKENQINKKAMEDKFKRLTNAMSEIQANFVS
ncbi:leucine-rich repeat and coiled-coil domain-containing protein 1-like [Ylistrum balloti]|uniref:leucine-rich repeat and coiled-coil domain-containing protein 1-like n=1 Tax=Ylistrum balloti TaxID=509963 RepID=UPI002905C64C|nr:leucine-rich repeat and coiled-coil domain-containing protein 1-like [Ylistrum balloti]